MCNGIKSILKSAFAGSVGSDEGSVLFLEPHHVRHHHIEAASQPVSASGLGAQHTEAEDSGRVMVLETIVRECGLPTGFLDCSKVDSQAWCNGLVDPGQVANVGESCERRSDTWCAHINPHLRLQHLSLAPETSPAAPGVAAKGDATSPQLMATCAAYAAVFDRTPLSTGSIGLINVRIIQDIS